MDPKSHALISPIWHIGKKLNTLYALNRRWECAGMWEIFLLNLEGKVINQTLDKWCIYFKSVDKKIN